MPKEQFTALLVCDEPLLGDFIADVLASAGCSVERADSADGVAQATTGNHDLVLLDLGWPETSGLALCQQIRARAHRDRLPVIALTDLPAEAREVSAFSIGPDDYLTKPFSIDALLATVARYRSPLD
jgi:two-component system, OmpR family, response regulator